MRFVAIYRVPGDPERFERDYRETHLPLVAQTPGLTHVEVSRVARTVVGEPLQLIAVMHFADVEAAKTAMASPQWAAAGRNLQQIGGMDVVTMATLGDAEVIDIRTST